MLRRVLANTAVMDRHIAEIISLGKEGRYDGIELDYERIWKDAPDLVPKLWTSLIGYLEPPFKRASSFASS